MARNEEKLFGRLNRLHLLQQRKVEAEKNPRRPHLADLNSPEEIRKWIPSISRDLDLAIKKLAVPCYPQRVIDDVEGTISKLRREYNQFRKKLKELDSNFNDDELILRPYSHRCKRQHGECESESGSGKWARLELPVLTDEEESDYWETSTIINDCDGSQLDKPLTFASSFNDEQYVLREKARTRNKAIDCLKNIYSSKDTRNLGTDITFSKDASFEFSALGQLSSNYSSSSDDQP